MAISGSTRKNSVNDNLIKAITELSAATMEIIVFHGIEKIPHFNPDNDDENVPEEVRRFRKQLDASAGVLICTPEYAHGVPGTLKNAIDWTVSSSNFPHKPTLLITAATDGSFGHKALMETLKAIQAKNIENLQLVIPFVKTKVSRDGIITDEATLIALKQLVADFSETMHAEEVTD